MDEYKIAYEISSNFDQSKLIETIGPWPFTTRRTYLRPDSSRVVWQSRHHRKGLPVLISGTSETKTAKLIRCLWMPGKLNWWIGIIFAAGSSLFLLGSLLTLAPALARTWSFDATAINRIFFSGSIPFTIAAYLQLFQAANAAKFSPDGRQVRRQSIVWFGWRPHAIGWLSCALQFLGTLFFNINTFNGIVPGLDRLQQELAVWAPNFLGSVLFLSSGYLAFIETCHTHWAWKPTSISWWITFINFLGCMGFMISALFAFLPPWGTNFDSTTVSVAFTFVGAIAFLIGSLLLLPETVLPAES